MQTINQLEDRISNRTRAARHLLNENGARRWSVRDQALFDALLDDAERTQVALEVQQSGASSVLRQWALERRAVDTFIRKPRSAWSDDENKLILNTMSTTTPSEGGYSVAAVVNGELADVLKGYGWMRQVAEEVTTTKGSDLGWPTSDGTSETGETMAQNAAATAADPSFGTRPVNTTKFGSKVFTVPIELLQDAAIDVVAFVFQRARDRIGRVQNAKFTIGTGTGEPTGLVTAATVGKTGTTGQTTTIAYDDLVDLVDSVDPAALGMPDMQAGLSASLPGWMMSQAMRKAVRKVKDTNGRPVWIPSTAPGEHAQLLDYPVYLNNDMPVPAANAKSLAFGNLRRYAIRDASKAALYRFDDSAFALKGQVGFLAIARAGGNLLDTSAVKLYQHSAT